MPAVLQTLSTFTWFDWFITLFLAFSVLRALLHGLLRELCWLAGVILGLSLATVFYDLPAPFLQHLIRSRHIDDALGFLLILFSVMLLGVLLGRAAHGTAKLLGLGWLDSLAGGCFGLLRGALLVTALLMALTAFAPHAPILARATAQSRIAAPLLNFGQSVSSILPGHMAQALSDGLTTLRNTH